MYIQGLSYNELKKKYIYIYIYINIESGSILNCETRDSLSGNNWRLRFVEESRERDNVCV